MFYRKMDLVVRVPGSGPTVGSGRVGSGGVTFILVSEPMFRRFYEFILHYVCHALHFHIK